MIGDSRPHMGCDPELFISLNGEVKGSHELIKKEGDGGNYSRIVRDGVQVEFNPSPDCCRAFLANNIKACFLTLRQKLDEKSMKVDFRRTIELTPESYDQLPEEAKRLGCMPSLSTDPTAMSISRMVDDGPVLTRSAGGHIHIGNYIDATGKWYKENDTRLTMLMDLVLANQCVMLDKDPANAVRRKLYGRAGEYRLPKHGYEYRTLSNFWLIHEAIFSLTFALARQAWNIALRPTDAEELLSLVDMGFVQHTINTNDVDMAKQTWRTIRQPIINMTPEWSSNPIRPTYVSKFDELLETGLEAFCPPDKWDIVSHWCKIPEGHNCGWGNFDIKQAIQLAEEMK